ncbi:MAG: recombinase family protein [Bdellovibrionota bacterium]
MYIRVSLKKQKEVNQIYALRNFCEAMGWSRTIEFVDKDHRGWQRSRPAFDELLRGVRFGRFDRVLVWSFDRASRDCGFSIQILDEFQSLGVQFYSYTQRIDTSDPYGRHQYIAIANDAELETAKISLRTKAGLERVKAEGRKLGRKPRVSKAQIVELRKSGIAAKEIAAQLGITPRYVRKVVREHLAS